MHTCELRLTSENSEWCGGLCVVGWTSRSPYKGNCKMLSGKWNTKLLQCTQIWPVQTGSPGRVLVHLRPREAFSLRTDAWCSHPPVVRRQIPRIRWCVSNSRLVHASPEYMSV